ncbi:hypothetical protein [Micromonospora sp. CPCC 206061]|uniref:hypothetical protein n=1 Tax=Micromonospora sp. CPCC 206061 TaxID=3122410 RepID=UPI002FF16002
MTSTARAAHSNTGEATIETSASTANDTAHGAPPRRTRLAAWARPYAPDALVCLVFLALAGWVTHGLWPDPGSRVMALNPEDQVLYEWFLAADTKFFFGDLSLLTDRLNAPDGVNLLANTTVIALGTLFTPVTLIFGVPVTFALIAAGNLAGTAVAWYFLYTRVLGARRFAAAVGGGLCGFGPGIISQNNSHLHMTAQWLVPVMVWLVVRMARAADPEDDIASRRKVITSGLWLAVTVAVQVFIGEEVLFLTAFTLAIMAIAYAFTRRQWAKRVAPGFLRGLGVTAGTAVVLLAYPLWFQFAGPQSVPNGVFSPHYFSADLASWTAISPLSIAGSEASKKLSTGAAEYNTFLGWPLLLVTVVYVVWQIRRPLVIACTVAGVLMAWLSLGPDIVLNGKRSDIHGPYSVLVGLPVVDGALPMRFALALLPLVATVLVLAIDKALRDASRTTRLVVPGVILAALLPIFPAPLPTADRPALPEFIAGGHWRECVQPGGVLVPVPLPTPPQPWAMRWAAAADAEFGLPEGFFIGPYGSRGKASMGIAKRPTSRLLEKVAKEGGVPAIGPDQLREAREDVAHWGASCVVLVDAPHRDDLRATLDALYGPGTQVADAWIWKV